MGAANKTANSAEYGVVVKIDISQSPKAGRQPVMRESGVTASLGLRHRGVNDQATPPRWKEARREEDKNRRRLKTHNAGYWAERNTLARSLKGTSIHIKGPARRKRTRPNEKDYTGSETEEECRSCPKPYNGGKGRGERDPRKSWRQYRFRTRLTG